MLTSRHELFATVEDAYAEFERTVAGEGMRAFLGKENVIVNVAPGEAQGSRKPLRRAVRTLSKVAAAGQKVDGVPASTGALRKLGQLGETKPCSCSFVGWRYWR
jgi:hypothetical protein